MPASQGETGSVRAARTGVRGGGAIAVHIAVDVAVGMVTARRLRVAGEAVVLVAFAALALRVLVAAVRCAMTVEVATAAIIAAKAAAVAATCAAARLRRGGTRLELRLHAFDGVRLDR